MAVISKDHTALSMFMLLPALLTALLAHEALAWAPMSSSRSGAGSSFLLRTTRTSAPRTLAATRVEDAAPKAPAPTLNGKRVLPFKVMVGGLKDASPVAAVYAVLNASHARGSEGWEATEYIGVTQDLAQSLQAHQDNHGSDKLGHVRALSFTFPQPNAMQDVAATWREEATAAGVAMDSWSQWENDVLEYLFEEEEEDDEEEEEDDGEGYVNLPLAAVDRVDEPIVSPFAQGADNTDLSQYLTDHGGAIAFTSDNVDKVLNEVRPYLIADGGNVSVERVEEAEKAVYLKLEGACGSCSSSAVTMQLGIERVLKEKFPNIKDIVQVESDPGPQELTYEAVETEIGRLKPAIMAMGGVVQIDSVDTTTGVVEIEFRGSSKVQQGLELAVLDIPFVTKVNFVMGDGN